MATITYDIAITTSVGDELYATYGEHCLVNGGIKLAQKILQELFTVKGSLPYSQSKGCEFITTLNSKNIYSEFDVRAAFAIAMLEITKKLKNDETDETPDDEKIESTTLESIKIDDGFLILSIYVYNKLNNLTKLVAGVDLGVT